jgi:hypothetical protein
MPILSFAPISCATLFVCPSKFSTPCSSVHLSSPIYAEYQHQNLKANKPQLAYARSQIEWAKKNKETWEEAKAEVMKIDES